MPLFEFDEYKCLYSEEEESKLRLLNEIVGGSTRNLIWLLGNCKENFELNVHEHREIDSIGYILIKVFD
jgi:hypothetical protein